ncbi:MAG TPA: helix-turn-helix transcriptional regulator [Candidatus Pullichristensenella stercorigallinarum]|uniref:Helix-turn-helix transcriptional regulator n=1 Tax=Candidatus Pullichristensenella stercorigallinarum TaxID=2840909 RepID=A0A9D0ZMC0_9FIRM|nr:helix-turn-helix transcriptional regulator [Candidatus Pullichristensenella stercorigallinarum]
MPDFYKAPRKTNNSPIARLRLERGLTQQQLAQKIGCLNKDVSRWEHGVCKPGASYLAKLSVALDCSIEALLQDEMAGQ